MQEEVENRTVNLAISTTKLTGRSLVNAFRAYLNHRRNVKARKASIQDTHIVGEQTIDQLLGQNQGATNIEIEKTEIQDRRETIPDGVCENGLDCQHGSRGHTNCGPVGVSGDVFASGNLFNHVLLPPFLVMKRQKAPF